MRTTILLVAIFLLGHSLYGQGLWSTTNFGGTYDNGTLYSIDTTGANHQLEFSFPKDEGRDPIYNYMIEANNKLYGMITNGGEHDDGVLFEYNPATGDYKVMHAFKLPTLPSEDDGAIPYSGLTLFSNGKLYGQTSSGGQNGQGTLFEFDPVAEIKTNLHHFNTPEGRQPVGSVVQYSPDTLIGTSGGGGASNLGTVYTYVLSSGTHTVEHSFAWAEGFNPTGELMIASNGKVYGTCIGGAANNNGSLFEYDVIADTVMIVHHFSDGDMPIGGLIEDGTTGILYGTTSLGGSNNDGILYEYHTGTATFTKKQDFALATNGEKPQGRFIIGDNGTMVATSSGGSGNIIEYIPSTNTLTEIFNFSNMPSVFYQGGIQPTGALCLYNNEVYGIAKIGGTENEGTVFKFNESTTIHNKLINLNGAPQGRHPRNALIYHSNGNMYGLTHTGGLTNSGGLFEYDLATGNLTVLQDFEHDFGENSESELLLHSNGNLYGVCRHGGLADEGVIFEYNISTQVYSVLHYFVFATGRQPFSGLIEGPGGLLYGGTIGGGDFNSGVLFKYDIGASSYQPYFHFNGTTDGMVAGATLAHYSGTTYFGTALWSSSSTDGTIFSVDLATDSVTTHFHFNSGSFGIGPETKLTLGSDGLFYGTTVNPTGNGSIYSFDPALLSFSHLQFLNLTVGAPPYEMYEANGVYLSNCYNGGNNSEGSIIAYDSGLNSVSVVHHFNGSDGAHPEAGFVLVPALSTGLADNVNSNSMFKVYPNPTSGIITLTTNSNEASQFQVVNVVGKVVHQFSVSGTATIDLSDEPQGVYFLRDQKGNTYRVVKL